MDKHYTKHSSIVVGCDGYSLDFDDGSRIYTRSYSDVFDINTVIEFSPDDFIGMELDLNNLKINTGHFSISFETVDGYVIEADIVSDSAIDQSTRFELVVLKKSNGVLEWSDSVNITLALNL